MNKSRFFKRGNIPQVTPAIEAAPAMESQNDYAARFIKRQKLKTRQCVYVSHDVHATIAKLVRVLVSAGNDLTVGGYIDTVLTEHLQANRDEINEVYRQHQGDLL